METVCGGKQWDVLLSQRGDCVEGALPYLFGHKFGLKYILQPQLTQFNGPWYRSDDPELRRRAGEDLAKQLRKLHAAAFLQHFPPDIDNITPFSGHGYRHSQRVTYRFNPIPDPDSLPSLANRGRKRGLDAVDSTYHIDKEVSTTEFADLHKSYWERRSGHDLIPKKLLTRVVQASLDRRQGLLYGLRDQTGQLMAARFVVYDDRCAYALLSALHPNALRNSMTRLVWTTIADLYKQTKIYDFEGSMDPGIAHFYRSFGTTPTNFFEVTRFRPRFLSLFFKR